MSMDQQQPAIDPELTLDEPVGSLEEALPLLRRPFTTDALHWKVQSSQNYWSEALVVPYIDVRLVIERLNLVCGEDWHEGDPERNLPAFEKAPVGEGLLCRLTLFGNTRCDVGSGYAYNLKGLFSDAMKRAGVKFGIGVALYAFPKTVLKVDEHGLLEKFEYSTKKGSKTTNRITPAGIEHLRGVHSMWLDGPGATFGKPLDHGDQGESTGDAEAETQPVEEEVPSTEHTTGVQSLQQSLREGDGQ